MSTSPCINETERVVYFWSATCQQTLEAATTLTLCKPRAKVGQYLGRMVRVFDPLMASSWKQGFFASGLTIKVQRENLLCRMVHRLFQKHFMAICLR